MRIKTLNLVFCFIFLLIGNFQIKAEKEVPVSTKKERNYITKGNELFNEGKYHEAINKYQEALKENPMSVVGRYNMGLSEIKIGTNPNDTTESAKKILESGCKNMEIVANLGKTRPDLASKANYNLGNVAFNSNDFQKAINYYKQALRFNPDDNDARRNLRIAQLKLQNEEQNEDQNQDQDQEQNQDQQDQQEENKDQNQNQDQDQEQNQDQDQNQDQNEEQQQDQQPDISQQNAEQILNAIENKENQTRARVAGQNAEKSRQRNRNKRNW